MKKFFAIVGFEYKKIIFKWSFLIGTFLLPILFACFALVPALIFSIKGEPTRLVIVDSSGKLADRLTAELSTDKLKEKYVEQAKAAMEPKIGTTDGMNQMKSMPGLESFIFEKYDSKGKADDAIRSELNARIVSGELDAYLLIPDDFGSPGAKFEYRTRKSGDFVAESAITDALNTTVRSQRMIDANIDEKQVSQLIQSVSFDSKGIDNKGDEQSGEGLMAASFIIGLMIYITLAIYGQAIMAAVIEEKETRIAEILFSSARPFQLMMGKITGVGLAGLTQLAIWVISAAGLAGFLASQSDLGPIVASIPAITPIMLLYFLIFFLLGFFIYASIFALIGSMVTTVQEGGQFAFPPIMILLGGFYLSFAVIRDPGSSVSFWASIAPFFAPITMPVRILAEMPPTWQILLAILLNGLAIAGLVWLASRVYRVGMLMYGKRATIPEVWKWIRQV